MKSEPLKGKRLDGCDLDYFDCYFVDDDIKSAVEWLITEEFILDTKFSQCLINLEEYMKEKYKLKYKAFEDVVKLEDSSKDL